MAVSYSNPGAVMSKWHAESAHLTPSNQPILMMIVPNPNGVAQSVWQTKHFSSQYYLFLYQIVQEVLLVVLPVEDTGSTSYSCPPALKKLHFISTL